MARQPARYSRLTSDIDTMAVRATSRLRRTPVARLAQTHINEAGLVHLTNHITNNNIQLKTLNNWLDDYEDIRAAHGQKYVVPIDMISIKTPYFTAIYDRVMFDGNHGSRCRLLDVDHVTSGGYLVRTDRNASRCMCDGVDATTGRCRNVIDVGRRANHSFAVLDDDHYVCVEVIRHDGATNDVTNMLVGTYHWEHFLRTLSNMSAVDPSTVMQLLTLPCRVVTETPQVVWLDHIMDEVEQKVHKEVVDALGTSEALLDVLTGSVRQALTGTVRDLMRNAHEHNTGSTASDAASVDSNGSSDAVYSDARELGLQNLPQQYTTQSRLLTSTQITTITNRIVPAVRLVLSGINLLERPLTSIINDPNIRALDEPLTTLIHRTSFTPNLRATALLKASAVVYGFKRFRNQYTSGWAKRRTDEKGKIHDVVIHDDGLITVNHKPICIVFWASSHSASIGLPYGDEIAARMWTLATDARRDISTLGHAEQESLDFLFAEREIKDKTIADLAEDYLAEYEGEGNS